MIFLKIYNLKKNLLYESIMRIPWAARKGELSEELVT